MQSCFQSSGRLLDAMEFQNMLKNEYSPLHNCVILSVTPAKYEIYILLKYLRRMAKVQAHILQTLIGSLDFDILLLQFLRGFLN